jgi:FlaA1/EpsC-like NDP-sugar epimerase
VGEMFSMDRRILNYLVIIGLSLMTFLWIFWVFEESVVWSVIVGVIIVRLIASTVIFKDYSLSWSKSTQKTFLIKSIVYVSAFTVYATVFSGKVHISLFMSELFIYLFLINLLMYGYYFYVNKSQVEKTKHMIIYGAGRAGLKLEEEYRNDVYKLKFFIDDAEILQKRSIDGIQIVSEAKFREQIKGEKCDLLVIAMPSASTSRIKEIYEKLHQYFIEVKILPPLENILTDKPFSSQLKDISVADLLARYPQDLDKHKISTFIDDKTILITGAGGSIGSELVRQCIKYNAKKLILLDHSEFNLYKIEQEIMNASDVICVMQSVVNKVQLQKTFKKHKPQIVIHAAAYKHVPLVEANIEEGVLNNVLGTKNCIDVAIENNVEKFILISTDKAVRPTNVMGATKRICELYAQNVVTSEDSKSEYTEIVAVRFGNVLGSSGSVIPKFKDQIERGQNITVTDPEITRYFMLIPEACELVLQAGAIGRGGEIFILDMGEPIKIVDLAKKMIELSGRDDIKIEFTGLRPGEKLYEELLIDDSDMHTEYESITVASPTYYDIQKLNSDIELLLQGDDRLKNLKIIVPEFDHKSNS